MSGAGSYVAQSRTISGMPRSPPKVANASDSRETLKEL